MACFGAALALSAFVGSRMDQPKVYIVNLVPATPALGSPAADPPAPTVRAPEAPRPTPPAPKAEKAEEKAPPKAARPSRPGRSAPRSAGRRAATAARPGSRGGPAEDARAVGARPAPAGREGEPDSGAAATRTIERSLPPPPPVTPPVAAPATPAVPPRLPEPPRIAAPPAAPTAPAAPVAPPTSPAPSRAAVEPQRPGRPNAPSVSGSNLSVDASDFPFTYYLRQLHAKVSERWRRPTLVQSEQASAVVYFEIDREGQLRGEPKIKQSSGNELYDQSALRAVAESLPFPPLPREFPGQFLKVNFGFDPGLNRG